MKTFQNFVFLTTFCLFSSITAHAETEIVERPSATSSNEPTLVGARIPTEKSDREAKDTELQMLPSLTTRELLNLPKNLARWHMGAVLFTASNGPLEPFNWRDADDGQSPGLLLGDDPSAELDLVPDVYKYVMELNDYYLVNRFTFKNFTAVGSIQVYASDSLVRSDSKAWQPLADPVEFSEEGFVSVRFDEVDSMYFMVVFDITVEGAIGIFGIYGDMSVAETRIPRTREDAEAVQVNQPVDSETTKFNFGSLATGSNITHISSGDPTAAKNMNDDDVETFFEFPEDSEQDVMIIDLAEQQDINRVSMLFESPPGVFDVYLTNDLPEGMEPIEEDLDAESQAADGNAKPSSPVEDEEMAFNYIPQNALMLAASSGGLGEFLALSQLLLAQDISKVTLPKSFFENNEYAMQFEVDGSEGRFRADFEEIKMRYVIISFTPAAGSPSGGLKVFEIGLFGDVPEEKRKLVRVPIFEFFANSIDLDPDLSPPGGGEDGDTGDGSPDGGGGAPRPPPPVSP